PLRHSEPLYITAPATTKLSTLSLHDALPISSGIQSCASAAAQRKSQASVRPHPPPTAWPLIMAIVTCSRFSSIVTIAMINGHARSEEHTSELQSRFDLVCRLPLEKKKKGNSQ